MNELSLKEKAILAVVGMIVAYAILVGYWFTSGVKQYKRSVKAYNTQVERYRNETKLISEREMWVDAYEQEKAQMPMCDAKKSADTLWLPVIEEMTKKHSVFVSKRQGADRETIKDEVREYTIDIKEWEASLESLVKFMHDIENTEEGMFDIKQITFKPNSSKKGFLKGSLSLTAAFMRKED